jgi:predicted NBD/HSP70 family sugar kinase
MDFTEREKRNLAILEILRKAGPLSRAQISKNLNLNVVTISNYIDNFLNKQLVLERELDISEGGRRPVLLDINPEAAYSIGVGINLFNTVAVLVDLKGNIVSRTKREPPPKNARDIVSNLEEVISETIKKTKEKSKIKGIGIGIAGIVNKKEGSIRWPEKVDRNYNYATITLPLKEILEKEFSFPVLIENDATCACFGESFLNLGIEVKNLIYMFSGVGCGMVINGQIFTGSTGCAGEVSIFNFQEDSLFNCKEGSPCFLKRWEQDLGMVEEAKTQITQIKGTDKGSKILELSEDDIDKINLKMIFQAAKAKDPLACSVLEKGAKRLGIKIAYLVNLLNPEVVIIGGGLEEAPHIFLETIKKSIDSWAFEEAARSVRIIYSELGEDACALGAASLIIQKIFSQT